MEKYDEFESNFYKKDKFDMSFLDSFFNWPHGMVVYLSDEPFQEYLAKNVASFLYSQKNLLVGLKNGDVVIKSDHDCHSVYSSGEGKMTEIKMINDDYFHVLYDSGYMQVFDINTCDNVFNTDFSTNVKAVSVYEDNFAYVDSSNRLFIGEKNDFKHATTLKYQPVSISFYDSNKFVIIVDISGWVFVWDVNREQIVRQYDLSKELMSKMSNVFISDNFVVYDDLESKQQISFNFMGGEFYKKDVPYIFHLDNNLLAVHVFGDVVNKYTFFNSEGCKVYIDNNLDFYPLVDINREYKCLSKESLEVVSCGNMQKKSIKNWEKISCSFFVDDNKKIELANIIKQKDENCLMWKKIEEGKDYYWRERCEKQTN
ncbi:MAG: hypothetical protein ACOC1P_00505 [Minisyncoccales bacterium]